MRRLDAAVLRIVALTAIFWALSFGAQAQNYPRQINIGSTAPGHMKFILHQHLGWLEEELAEKGIEVNWYPFVDGGSAVVTALATGSLDVAYTGNNPALRVGALDTGIHLIGLSSFTPSGGSSIVVAADSPYQSVADLEGKRVAYLQGTVRHSTLAKALGLHELTTGDIQSINMPFSSSGPALLRGEIDALVESENTAHELLRSGAARILLNGVDYPEWSAPSAIQTRADIIRDYPELLETLLEVDLRVSQWADENYDETIAIHAAATNLNEELLRATYSDGRFYQDPLITPEAIEAFQLEEAFMSEAGLLRGQVNYDTWVEERFVNAVYERAGLENGAAAQAP